MIKNIMTNLYTIPAMRKLLSIILITIGRIVILCANRSRKIMDSLNKKIEKFSKSAFRIHNINNRFQLNNF
jgi:hypothetical protein